MIGISQGTRLLPFADAVSLPGWVALCGPTKGPERRKMTTTKVETNNAAARVKKIISRAGSFLQCEWMNHLKLEWVCVCVSTVVARDQTHTQSWRESVWWLIDSHSERLPHRLATLLLLSTIINSSGCCCCCLGLSVCYNVSSFFGCLFLLTLKNPTFWVGRSGNSAISLSTNQFFHFFISLMDKWSLCFSSVFVASWRLVLIDLLLLLLVPFYLFVCLSVSQFFVPDDCH